MESYNSVLILLKTLISDVAKLETAIDQDIQESEEKGVIIFLDSIVESSIPYKTIELLLTLLFQSPSKMEEFKIFLKDYPYIARQIIMNLMKRLDEILNKSYYPEFIAMMDEIGLEF